MNFSWFVLLWINDSNVDVFDIGFILKAFDFLTDSDYEKIIEEYKKNVN